MSEREWGQEQEVPVEIARSGSVETSYVLKVASLGIAYGFDVECERNRG